MGAAALVPFVPNRLTNHEAWWAPHPPCPRIDSTITLVTNDDPINYRTIVHAYDMTLETVMDEYTPYDNEFLRAVAPFQRTMTLSNLPDNYDKYELSVWKSDMIRTFRAPRKVFSRTYDLGFPAEVFINLTGRNV